MPQPPIKCLCVFLATCCTLAWLGTTPAKAQEPTQILFVVGPSTHAPGTHEVEAGCRLLAHCLETSTNLKGIQCTVSVGWPKSQSLLKTVDTIVFSGDRFPLAELKDTRANMQQLSAMMDRGCGLVCYHYATGLTQGQMPDDGAHPLLEWMGGYFATRCVHHQSTARIFEAARIELNPAPHPVLRGVEAFTIHDEPYINNYFGPNGLEKNVTPLMTSMLPPESPKPEIVAWAVERSGGGRGLGIVMPHFYRNWKNEDLRKSILNGIVWTAGRDVPQTGVQSAEPKLADFSPASVLPK